MNVTKPTRLPLQIIVEDSFALRGSVELISSMDSWTIKGLILFGVLLVVALPEADAKRPLFQAGPWNLAHATFYGNPDGSGTFEGACGYGEEQKQSYGVETTALSSAMFNNGAACGACYEIKCANDPQWCNHGSPSTFVTATNLCPPSSGADAWCNPPRQHFDLSQPAFLKIAQFKAGIVPVQYRRVPCKRAGGIRFTISTKSNPNFLLVLVWNVGGAGDVVEVQIQGSDGKPWRAMKRNWGQYWQADENLVGQQLSFRVKASDARSSVSWRVAPSNWQFGQTYVGKNFR